MSRRIPGVDYHDQPGGAPASPKCNGCSHTIGVRPAVHAVDAGFTVTTFQCRHTKRQGGRCLTATAIVCEPMHFPRYFFARNFTELEQAVIARYGEKARWSWE